MSFYLDDDEDDAGHGGDAFFRRRNAAAASSEQHLIQQQHNTLLSQNNGRVSTHRDNNNNNDNDDDNDSVIFVCENCGNTDSYYEDDITGNLICNMCFTQSQNIVSSSQQQFDYEDAMNMASKSRDGRIIKNQQLSQLSQTISSNNGIVTTSHRPTKKKIGRPSKSPEEYDTSQSLPSLEDCIYGFQIVIQRSCYILCYKLMTIMVEESAEGNDNEHNNNNHTQRHKQQIYKDMLVTLKDLWKAYMFSWNEGAEHYSKIYPLARFSFRDYFLNVGTFNTFVQKALAYRAKRELQYKINQEKEEAESDEENNNDMKRRSVVEVDNNFEDSDDNIVDGNSTELEDSLIHEIGGLRKARSQLPTNKIEISTSKHQQQNWSRLPKKRKRKNCNIKKHIGNNVKRKGSKSKGGNQSDDAAASDDHAAFTSENDEDEDGTGSVASDLSHRELSFLPQRKEYEDTVNTNARLIYLHFERLKKQYEEEGKEDHMDDDLRQMKLGRKEAALIIQPSMVFIMGMLWIASAQYGVTGGQIAGWIQNGSLPLLNAFDHLLPLSEQEKLKPISGFFKYPFPPTIPSLRRVVTNLHVACGYKPPPVKLQKRDHRNSSKKEVDLTHLSLYTPGRLIRPSVVPSMLANLIADLGLSQKVLNYSLALMGLPVSRQALIEKDTFMKEKKDYHDQENKIEESNYNIDDDDDGSDTDYGESDTKAKKGDKVQEEESEESSDADGSDDKSNTDFSDSNSDSEDSENTSDNSYDEDEDSDEGKKTEGQNTSPEVHRPRRKFIAAKVDDSVWLPPSLSNARPDRLEDTERILAVIVVACRLIYGWDQNCNYRFAKASKNGANEDIMKSDDDDGDSRRIVSTTSRNIEEEKKAKRFRTNASRFVPWTHEHFQWIGNGKYENEYLDFLEEILLNSNSYVLPRFVDLLNKSLEASKSNMDDSDVTMNPASVVKPNSYILRVNAAAPQNQSNQEDNSTNKNNETSRRQQRQQHDIGKKKRKKHRKMQIPYRIYTNSDLEHVRSLDPPMGPFVEFIAYKTGTIPEQIFRYMIKLDHEIKKRKDVQKQSKLITVSPDIAYELVMNSK